MSDDTASFDVDSNSLDILDDNEGEASPDKKEMAIVEDVRKYFFDAIDSDAERKFIMRWGGITFKATVLSLLAIGGVLSFALLLIGITPLNIDFYLIPLFFCALALLFAVVFFADKKRVELDDEKLVCRSRMYAWIWNREISVSAIAQFHVEPFEFMRNGGTFFGVYARLKDGSDIKILSLMKKTAAKLIETRFEKFLQITDAPVRFPAPRTMKTIKQDGSYVIQGYPKRSMTGGLGGMLVFIIGTLIMLNLAVGVVAQPWEIWAFVYAGLGYLLARIIFLYITPSQITLKQDGIFIQGFGTGSEYLGRGDQEPLSANLWVFLGIRPKRQWKVTQDKHAIYYEFENRRHWNDSRGGGSSSEYEVVLVQPNADQKEFVGKSMQLEQARFIAQEITVFYGLDEYNYAGTKVHYFRSHG